MKTEQEQIEEMAHIMCEYYNSGFCANSDMTEICEDMPDCCYKNEAEALYNAGYGDVSEYKAEIERLKANGYISIMDAFENNRDKIVENIQTEIDDYKQSIKQAQIDVVTKLKKKYGFYIVCSWGRPPKLLAEIIDEFIEEVEDGKEY